MGYLVEIPGAGRRPQRAGDPLTAASEAVRQHISTLIRQPGATPLSYDSRVFRVRVFEGAQDLGEFDARVSIGGFGDALRVTVEATHAPASSDAGSKP